MPVARHILELLAHEHVLLVYRIAFAQRLCDGGEQACELVVAVDVGRILLHGVLHPQDGRVFPSLGVQHPDAVHVLHGEIDVLEDALVLAARPKAWTEMAMPAQRAMKISMMYSVIVGCFLLK